MNLKEAIEATLPFHDPESEVVRFFRDVFRECPDANALIAPGELTAEQRARFEHGTVAERKLLRLYGAALARAEAADKRVQKLTGLLGWDPMAAESRLDDATACIKGVRGYLHSTNAGSTFNLPGPVAQRARDLIAAFLSTPAATTAPAAPTETPASPENCPLDCMRSDGTPHPLCPSHGTPASPEPMPEGWERTQHERQYYHEAGFWVLACLPNGLEIQHGGEDNARVSLSMLQALLATQGLTVVDEASANVLEAMAKVNEAHLEFFTKGTAMRDS